MISTDRDALVCDLVETYGILDWKVLPVRTLATLAVGLREESRIKMRMSGSTASRRDMLLAAAVDMLSLLVWKQTEDGRKGENCPRSILSVLLGEPQESGGEIQAFEEGADFKRAWKQITGVEDG